MKVLTQACLAAAALAAGAAVHAGSANVMFVEPNKYYDIGFNESSRKSNLEAIQQQFADLTRPLPANMVLRVEVLDVDLAGRLAANPTIRRTDDMRVVRAGDWPRMHLRYVLEVDGATQRSGDEWVKAQDFQNNYDNQPMEAEKRMLRRWFKERFAAELAKSQ